MSRQGLDTLLFNAPRDDAAAIFPGLRSMVWLRYACLGVVGLCCLMALEGHLFGIEVFYSFHGKAVFSVPTLVAMSLSAAAVLLQHPLRGVGRPEGSLWLAVIVTAIASRVLHERGLSVGPGEMGANTAVSFVLLAVGQLSFARLRQASFTLSMMSMTLPFLALSGYLYNEPRISGAMSLSTSIALLCLGIASTARFARRPMMRSVISASRVGHAIRVTTLLWVGWLVMTSIAMRMADPEARELMAVFMLILSSIAAVIAMLHIAQNAEQRRLRHRSRDRSVAGALERDSLTGLHDRRMAELFMHSFGSQSAVSLMLIGIDQWGAAQRRLGPDAAEEMFRQMCSALRAEVGADEQLVMWQKGRVLVMSRAASAEWIKQRAEQLRNCAMSGLSGDEGADQWTVSAGASCTRKGDTSMEPGIFRAISALVEAERVGCDRVVLALVA
ncbi:hypothetical protein GCM10011415_26860 [Salipiger pallidus]|uniref:GGDEF domain-containing protein n=1 Tax=Salipiger pallidus TaxID=1775170 RepID=A0A8J3EH76_9RHOB|nr:GGDEF domain-containing protein [Salipiger pallidus]GGG76704.1 hypothetical protein GCM10011415_26860 [Salipiger pallidus]